VERTSDFASEEEENGRERKVGGVELKKLAVEMGVVGLDREVLKERRRKDSERKENEER
jgi:hypothetical protein